MNEWQLEAQGTGKVVVERLKIADGYWSRLCGLQFRRPLPPGHGLLIVPCASVHTMWMRFAIDAVMLDRFGTVLEVREAVSPWRIVWAPRGTHAVLEATAGNLRIAVGDLLTLRSRSGQTRPPAPLSNFRLSAGIVPRA